MVVSKGNLIPTDLLFQNMIERTPDYGSPDKCWLMNGYCDSHGCPLVWDGERVHRVIRISWEHYFGPITMGHVRQACGEKRCWNPEHLKLGGKSGTHAQRPPKPEKDKITKVTKARKKTQLKPKILKTYEESLYERLNKYRLCGLSRDDCYKWVGATQGGPRDVSYGVLGDKRKKTNPTTMKKTAAHRLAYEFEVGPIPEGKWILHSCDNPPCTNPLHLRFGGPPENAQDRVERGRLRVHTGDDHWTHLHPESLPRGDEHWARQNPDAFKGEKNGNAILTETDVLRIRAEWDGTWESSRWLAGLYAVATQTIQGIVRRKTWKHLPARPDDHVADPERAWARGEHIKNALLTAEIVTQIRSDWDHVIVKNRARAEFCRQQARRYGVESVAIDKIVRRINWRHV